MFSVSTEAERGVRVVIRLIAIEAMKPLKQKTNTSETIPPKIGMKLQTRILKIARRELIK